MTNFLIGALCLGIGSCSGFLIYFKTFEGDLS